MIKYVRAYIHLDEALRNLFFSVMGINNLVGVKITPGWCGGPDEWRTENELECQERKKKTKYVKKAWTWTWTHHSTLSFVWDISVFISLLTPCNFTHFDHLKLCYSHNNHKSNRNQSTKEMEKNEIKSNEMSVRRTHPWNSWSYIKWFVFWVVCAAIFIVRVKKTREREREWISA